MSRDELRPGLKLVGYPIIFTMWCLYRLTHVRYVDSPSFLEYWRDL